VADGYARNFLFPKHLAVQASKPAVDELAAKEKKKAKEEASDLSQQQNYAARLDGLEIEIKGKVNDKGLLYAAVGPQIVSAALKKLGFDLDKHQIIMKPIKEAGDFPVKVKFRHGLEAEVKVMVLAG